MMTLGSMMTARVITTLLRLRRPTHSSIARIMMPRQHDDRKGHHYSTPASQADVFVYSSDDPCGHHVPLAVIMGCGGAMAHPKSGGAMADRKSLRNIFRYNQGARLDLGCKIVGFGLGVGRHITADSTVANTIVRQIELGRVVGIAAILEVINRVVDSGVNTLESTGDNDGIHGTMIGINDNAEDMILIGSIECTDATTTGNLEDDVSLVLADLALSHVFIFSGCCEVLRVVDEDVDARINLFRTELVTSDVAVDWRDGQTTHGTDSVFAEQARNFALTIYFHLSRHRTNEAASLLLFEEERRNIRQIIAGGSISFLSTTINNGKLLVGVLRGHLIERCLHQEANSEHEVGLLCG